MLKGVLSGLAIGGLFLACVAGCARKTIVEKGPDASSRKSTPITSTPLPVLKDAPAEFKEISITCLDRRIPVLMYHSVIADAASRRSSFDITVAQFQSDLDWLQSHGWTPISLDTLYKHLTEGSLVPEKSVVLTFDDGYKDFIQNAYPLLKARQIPAAMFVHTGHVGSQENTPKMSWDDLKTLVQDGLVQIGSHTVSHPEDLTHLYSNEIRKEFEESKKTLEEKLKIPIRYLAYPNGKNDASVQKFAMKAGYLMAFTTERGPVQESPGILALNRTIASRCQEACEQAEKASKEAPATISQTSLIDRSLEVKNGYFDGRKVRMILGGKPKTWLSAGRYPVGKIVSMAHADAGVNGGYFALSALKSDSNQMIGPCLTSNQKEFQRDEYLPRLPKLKNRPVVVIGPNKVAIFPFQNYTNDRKQIEAYMPDVTDVFMAGAWFVHEGQPRPWKELKVYCAKDINDFRRRAFFGVMQDGRIVIGASIDSLTTQQLGEALVGAGVKEAVLLDSGFSTSLVFGDRVLASGHDTPTEPSRPIPHSILLFSDLPPAAENVAMLRKIAAERS